MKYMLLIYADEQVWTEPERQDCYNESTQLCHQLQSKGKFISGSPLQPVATATSVQVRSGKRLVTDGPFAETREQLGGYFMVEAKDLDEDVLGDLFGGKFRTGHVIGVAENAALQSVVESKKCVFVPRSGQLEQLDIRSALCGLHLL